MSLSDDFSYRLGAGALGMFAGAAIGLAILGLQLALENFFFPAALLILGGGGCGLLTGLLFPSTAIEVFEETMHFFFGALSVVAEESLGPYRQAPRRLVAASFFGAVYIVFLWLFA